MKQRILVAIIGVPALIGVLCFAPDWATAVLVAALCVIGCHEFMAAAAPEKAAHWWGLAATLAVFTVFTVYFSGGDFTGTAIHTIMVWLLAALIVVMFIAAVQAFGKDDELDFPDISAMAVSGLVIPLALGCLVRLRMLEYGAGLVLIPLVSAFMSDSLALFGGMLFGKTKLAPRVSPKKTRRVRSAVWWAAWWECSCSGYSSSYVRRCSCTSAGVCCWASWARCWGSWAT